MEIVDADAGDSTFYSPLGLSELLRPTCTPFMQVRYCMHACDIFAREHSSYVTAMARQALRVYNEYLKLPCPYPMHYLVFADQCPQRLLSFACLTIME